MDRHPILNSLNFAPVNKRLNPLDRQQTTFVGLSKHKNERVGFSPHLKLIVLKEIVCNRTMLSLDSKEFTVQTRVVIWYWALAAFPNVGLSQSTPPEGGLAHLSRKTNVLERTVTKWNGPSVSDSSVVQCKSRYVVKQYSVNLLWSLANLRMSISFAEQSWKL